MLSVHLAVREQKTEKTNFRDKVLRVTIPTGRDFQNLMNLLQDTLPIQEIDVWREPSEHPRSAAIYVKHQDLSIITGALQENGFTFVTFIENVQRWVTVCIFYLWENGN